MTASNRDPFSQSTPGNVRGSAAKMSNPVGLMDDSTMRTGSSNPRPPSTREAPDPRPVSMVARDSGTNGLALSRAERPGDGMARKWLPLSTPSPNATPNAGDQLVKGEDAVVDRNLIESRDELGEPAGAGERQINSNLANPYDGARQTINQDLGVMTGAVTISKTQDLGDDAPKNFGVTSPRTMDRKTGKPDKTDKVNRMDD